jgi:acetyl-CoA carboxylase carboxyltransferase component
MTWEPELEELRRREELARRMGGEERVTRQRASGRLTVRERIERLFDAGSFHETGALAGRGSYDEHGELTDFLPANTVVGQGRIDGRRAMVQGDDFTVRGGAADAAIWEKAVYAERLAHDLRLPLVRLVDGTGGGSVKTLEQMGFSYVPPLPGFDLVVKNLSIVPVVAAALGPVAGLGAARVVCSHFSLIVKGTAQLFVAGPPVVATAGMGEAPDKEALGGSRLQSRAGAVDNVAEDEDDAFDQIRRYLAYLPANVWEAPRAVGSSDPTERREECARSSSTLSTAAPSSSSAPPSAAPPSPALPGSAGGRSVSSRPIPSTTAAASRLTLPRRRPASSTAATSSTCRS